MYIMKGAMVKVSRYICHADSPSPADYNLIPSSTINAFKTVTIPQSERFSASLDPSPSPSSMASEKSCNKSSTPLFRTPSLPRKLAKKLQMVVSLKHHGSSSTTTTPKKSEKSTTQQLQEQLNEKLVECTNKDISICNLTEQLEQLQKHNYSLQSERESLVMNNDHVRKQFEQLTSKHHNTVRMLTTKQREQLQLLQTKTKMINRELEAMKSDSCKMRLDNHEDLVQLLDSIQQVRNVYSQTMAENQSELEQKSHLIKHQEMELESLHVTLLELQQDFERNRKEMNELDSERHQVQLRTKDELMQIVNVLREECTKANHDELICSNDLPEPDIDNNCSSFGELILHLAELISQHFHNFTALKDAQLKQFIYDLQVLYTEQLEKQNVESKAILKEFEERTNCDNNITEEQQKQLQLKIVEQQKLLETAEQMYRDEHDAVIKMQNQLLEMQKQLVGEEHNCTELHNCYIAIRTHQQTIDVLQKRLLNSDSDVEQLKEELSNTETKLLEFENKCVKLTNLIETMEESNIQNQLDVVQQFTDTKLKPVEQELCDKVDRELEKLKQKCHMSDEIYKQLHEQQQLLLEAQQLIRSAAVNVEDLEGRCDQNKLHNAQLEADFAQLQKQLADSQSINAVYEKRLTEQESLIGPFREQLQVYETERKILLDEKQCLEHEADEITSKYVDVLGHHNQNQKIRHLMDLKNRIVYLKNDKIALEMKLRSRNRYVDSLEKELNELRGQKTRLGIRKKRTTSEADKENSVPATGKVKLEPPANSPLRQQNAYLEH